MASFEDPFDTTRVLTIPELSLEDDSQWHGFRLQPKLKSDVFALADVADQCLQDVQPTHFVLDLEEAPIPALDVSSESSYTTADEDGQEDAEDEFQTKNYVGDEEYGEDIWRLPEIINPPQHSQLTGWDHFTNKDHHEPPTGLLSEAGAAAFDAMIARSGQHDGVSFIYRDKFLDCLSALTFGTPSVLFSWDETTATFVLALEAISITGCTPYLVSSILESIMPTCTVLKKLSEPDVHYFGAWMRTRPSVIAFAAALTSCLAAIHRAMDDRLGAITTVIGLQGAFATLQPLVQLLEKVTVLATTSENDLEFVGCVLSHAPGLSLQWPQFKAVIDCIIARVFAPISQDLCCKVGLNVQNSEARPELQKSTEQRWSQLLSPELRQIIAESQVTLRLLQNESPEALARIQSTTVSLNLAFSWTSLLRIQVEAADREKHVRSMLRGFDGLSAQNEAEALACENLQSSSSVQQTDPFVLLDLSGAQPENITGLDLVFSTAMECMSSEETEEPPQANLDIGHDEVMNISLLPTLSAQHRLLSYSIFKALFLEHKALSHLRLQRRIHLLGDGMFAARLRVALFDSEQGSGETRRNTSATTGLRLQTRDTWPPASSELRLVLMGLLSESLRSSNSFELEDTISFAMRDLSDEELDLCKDVNSIHALDFLKIQYKASNSIVGALISPDCLEKYDKIFRHILLVLRLQSVTEVLLRTVSSRHMIHCNSEAQNFRREMHQFITALAHYTQNIAIGRHWEKFERLLNEVEQRLSENDYDGVLRAGRSLHYLKYQHEEALDSILRSLFLKKKQKQILTKLHEISGVILEYAGAVRSDDGEHADTQQYHGRFRDSSRLFVASLQALTLDETMTAAENDFGDLIEEWLVLLDINGYWSR